MIAMRFEVSFQSVDVQLKLKLLKEYSELFEFKSSPNKHISKSNQRDSEMLNLE